MRHFQEHLARSMSVPETKHFSIGYVNSVGNGFGEIESLDHINRYKALMSDGKLKVDCKDIKTMEKYFKVLMNADYFINYQSKIAADYVGDTPIEGMTVNGIFKKVGGVRMTFDTVGDKPDYRHLEINVERVDTETVFNYKVSKNFSDWSGDVAPATWDGSKSVMFRGSVGNVLESNYRHEFIVDFMKQNNYI
jgi:hypothetical protein